MRVITNKRQLNGTSLFERPLSELKKNLRWGYRLIEKRAVFQEGRNLYVAQEVWDDDHQVIYKWDLVDWYLDCDSYPEEMSPAEIKAFLGLGGHINTP